MLIDFTYKPTKEATYTGAPSRTTKVVTTKPAHLFLTMFCAKTIGQSQQFTFRQQNVQTIEA